MTEEVDYAKRAVQRRDARNALRPIYDREDLAKMVKILGDRLALALHIMSDHKQFIEHETTPDQMKYLEDWVETLLEVEDPPKGPGRAQKWDYYRKVKRYEYLRSGIRGMLRRQLKAL